LALLLETEERLPATIAQIRARVAGTAHPGDLRHGRHHP
jgi:hypothetical protein